MRILLAHNFYGSAAPSGENRVFEAERDMLKRYGHEVETLERHSDKLRQRGGIGLIKGALAAPWNIAAAREVREKVAKFKPDVVHVHNTFPLLSPAIFPAAVGAARVLTLHNYRLKCAAGIPMRDGQPCMECIDRRSVYPALRHGCYRGSRFATIPLAASIALHNLRRTWHNDVESFIALSDFQRRALADGGLPIDRMEVKPHFHPGSPDIVPFEQRPMQVVFVGRLSEEKGVASLIEAWRIWGSDSPVLKIVGDGPLKAHLLARTSGVPNVHFTGQLDHGSTMDLIAKSRLLLLPSLCHETFGMTLVEAFSRGVPIGVSRMGHLPALARQVDGLVFTPGDARDIKRRVAEAWAEQAELGRISDVALRVYDRYYSESANYRQLVAIYKRAMARMAVDRIRDGHEDD